MKVKNQYPGLYQPLKIVMSKCQLLAYDWLKNGLPKAFNTLALLLLLMGSYNDITAQSCDNVINGGIIEADEFGCPSPTWNPSPITNVQLPAGGTGNLEYIWIFTTDDPTLPSAFWNPIPGSNGANYDPGPISITTYYRRCARRSGCTDYIGESNIIMKEAICCDNVTNGGKIQADQVLCNASEIPDSLINLALPTGGTNELEYQWVLSTTDTSYSASNPAWSAIPGADEPGYNPGMLSETTYFIRLSRRHGCLDYDGVSNRVTITINPPINADISGSDETCLGAGNGFVEVTNISGGTPGYTFEWIGFPSEIDSSLLDLSAGNYTAIIIDANDCTDTLEYTLNEGPALTITISATDVLCPGDSNGVAIVTGVGNGISPYTYAWNDPLMQTGMEATGLYANTYEVVVTDSIGCIGTETAVINDPIPLDMSLSSTDALCDDSNDGTATALVSGGSTPYGYEWSDPLMQTAQTAVGLSMGTYSVTVTDANGCTLIDSVSVGAPMPEETSITSTDVSCFGGNDGTAEITIINGDISTYSVSWSNGNTTPDITGLSEGQYFVTVTNPNGCSNIDSVTINQPTEIILVMDADSASCYNSSDGTAIVMVSGGTPFPNDVYTYLWDAPGNPAVQMLDDVSPGTYSVTVTDANGCTAVGSVEIGAPSEIIITSSKVDVSCNGFTDGSASVQVQGGSSPYSYNWNDTNNSTTSSISNLAAGTYSVSVFDANFCLATSIINIDEPLALSLDFANSDVICDDDTNGSVVADPIGGTSPYTYLWDSGETTQALFNVGVGQYEVTVTDDNGCEISAITDIVATTTLSSSVSATDASCFESNDGVAVAAGVGGLPPYSYAWSNGENTSQISNLFFGSYTVTITDADGCTVTNTAVINAPPPIIAQIEILSEVLTYGGNEGSAVVIPSGGLSPYTIEWEDGSTNDTLLNIEGGTISVVVTDANNCTGTGEVTFIEPSKIGNYVWNDENQNGIQNNNEVGIEGINVSLYGITTTNDTINLSTVTDTAGFYAFDGLDPGNYKVTFETEPNHVFTYQNVGNDNFDSDADPNTGETQTIFLSQGEYEDRWDCGMIILDEKINIGDKVWYDMNQDGIQGLNEAGVQNVIVRLIEASTNSIIDVQITNVVGYYLFTDVMPGNYKVEFVLASLPAGGYIISPKDQGTDDTKDSDANIATGLTDQFTVFPFTLDNLTIDAGIYKECDNITDGGVIGYNENLCGVGANPDEIVDVISPSGGFGVIEYLWMKSSIPVYNGQGDPNWVVIPNSNSPTYDPGPISTSTYYIRCARRQGCSDYIGESNVVAKVITSYPLTQIIDEPETLCKNEDGRFEAAIAGAGATYFWEFENGNPSTASTRVVNPVTWPDQGVKNVSLTVTRFGCSFTVNTTVFIDNCGSNPLVEFDNLFASLDGDKVNIDWKVNGNTDFTIFYVESSEDGENFRTIANVKGEQGMDTSNYSFTDEQPKFGENIYRIKYTILSPHQESGYSVEASIMYHQEATVLAQVYPNPTKDKVTIELLKPIEEASTVEVVNAIGNRVHAFEIPANTEKFELEMDEFYQGLYFVVIQQPKLKTQICKVFKID